MYIYCPIQVNILHPLATLEWDKPTPLPGLLPGETVTSEYTIVKDKIYISIRNYKPECGMNTLLAMPFDFSDYKRLSTPVIHYGLAWFRSQLVLVGEAEQGPQLQHAMDK